MAVVVTIISVSNVSGCMYVILFVVYHFFNSPPPITEGPSYYSENDPEEN